MHENAITGDWQLTTGNCIFGTAKRNAHGVEMNIAGFTQFAAAGYFLGVAAISIGIRFLAIQFRDSTICSEAETAYGH